MKTYSRYMQDSPNGNYRYVPPADAVEAGIVKRCTLTDNYDEALKFCEEQNLLLDEWRNERSRLKQLSEKSNVGDVVAAYKQSNEYIKLQPKTKQDYAYYLSYWLGSKTAGTTLAKTRLCDLSTPAAQRIYDMHSSKSVSLSNHSLAVYRLLMSYAIRNGYTKYNVFTDVVKQTDKPRRVTWEKEHVKAFMDTAFTKYEWRNIGLLAYMAYSWAQRLGDMRMLTWSCYNVDTGVLTLTQSKRRAKVTLPTPASLQAMLKQQHKELGWQPYIVPNVKRSSKPVPYTLTALSKIANDIMEAAKLPPELQLRDLRRTAITELLEVGVPVTNVMSVSGHATAHSLTPYLRHSLKSATVAFDMRGQA
jgi:integrase